MKILLKLILITLTIAACSSPQKTFNKGNYESAFKQTFKKLKKGKATKEDKAILTRSLNELNKTAIVQADTLGKSPYIEDWEQAYEVYETLVERNEKVFELLPDALDVELDFYNNKKEQLGQMLIKEYIIYGQENLEKSHNTGLKKFAQEAYRDFDKAIYYGGDENQLSPMQEEAVELGKVYYNIVLDTRFHQYEWEIKNEFRKLSYESSTFKDIRVEEPSPNVDCNIEIVFQDIYFNIEESSDQMDYADRVITGYETVVDTAGRTTEEPIYETVTATVARVTYYKTARIDAGLYVDAATRNCDFEDRNFSETIQDKAEIRRVYGDERAVPAGERNSEEELESDEDMAEELIDDLFVRIRRRF